MDVDQVNRQLADLFGTDAPRYERTAPPPFLVLPENWAAVQCFLDCQTQWRIRTLVSMAGSLTIYEGLNYTGVKVVMDTLYTDQNPKDLFMRLQIMEREALALLNAQT